jgi:flagellar M-ring protein FliF
VGGVPGAASNNGAVPTYQGGSNGSGSTTRTDKEVTYELNKSVKKVVTAPGSVTRMSVSVMVDDDPANPNPTLIQNVQNAVNAAAGINTQRGDALTVTALPFNRDELLSTQAAMNDAAQKEQLMNYLHLGALAVGPVLMLIVLFVLLKRGRKKSASADESVNADAQMPRPHIVAAPDAAPTPGPMRPARPPMVAQAITEDPQKVYIREQIQALGKTNPNTVAQLIQTWMDEDRRN